jgi:C_GCAxxG_C_C family probable redox protein
MTGSKEQDPRVADAVATFGQGFNCAQAVLAAFSERYGLDRTTAKKLATAYGGGMASSGATCGAVTGALMVIGLAHGRTEIADMAARARTYALTRQLWKEFQDLHGSIACRELLGVDISTPEGTKAAQQAGLFRELCPCLVRDAAAIVARIV